MEANVLLLHVRACTGAVLPSHLQHARWKYIGELNRQGRKRSTTYKYSSTRTQHDGGLLTNIGNGERGVCGAAILYIVYFQSATLT